MSVRRHTAEGRGYAPLARRGPSLARAPSGFTGTATATAGTVGYYYVLESVPDGAEFTSIPSIYVTTVVVKMLAIETS